MNSLDFRIAPEAVEFLQKHLLRATTGELLVLTIAPQSSEQNTLRLGSSDLKLSDRRLAALAKDYLQSLSPPIALQWVVGGIYKSRLRGEELLLIDGIECFFPDEVKAIVSGRVLRLRNGELIFDPDLDPPPSLSLSRPDAEK